MSSKWTTISRAVEFAGRAAALLAAVGWGISIAGLLVSSSTAFELLNGMGADDLAYNPMVDYWLRMTAFAFTAIGLQFLVVAIWWRRRATWAWWAAVFQVLGGVVLLVSADRIGLASGNFHADVLFCFSTGFLMAGSLAASWWIERVPPTTDYADPQS
jgi:hypothetical protein